MLRGNVMMVCVPALARGRDDNSALPPTPIVQLRPTVPTAACTVPALCVLAM